jgi:hypothetical protein
MTKMEKKTDQDYASRGTTLSPLKWSHREGNIGITYTPNVDIISNLPIYNVDINITFDAYVVWPYDFLSKRNSSTTNED